MASVGSSTLVWFSVEIREMNRPTAESIVHKSFIIMMVNEGSADPTERCGKHDNMFEVQSGRVR